MSQLPPDDFLEMLSWLGRKAAEQERRNRTRSRIGTIVEVDAQKGVARVNLNEAGFKTGWIPWQEQSAGGAKTHWPPTIGQQVRVKSESGDMRDAEIEISMPSEANPRPSQASDERVLLDVGPERSTSTQDGLQYRHEIDTMSHPAGDEDGKSYYRLKPREVFLHSLDPGRQSWVRIRPEGITTFGGGLSGGGGTSDSYSERRHTVRVRDEPYPHYDADAAPDDPSRPVARFAAGWGDDCIWRWRKIDTCESVLCMLPDRAHLWVHDERTGHRSDLVMTPDGIVSQTGDVTIAMDRAESRITLTVDDDTLITITPGRVHLHAAIIETSSSHGHHDLGDLLSRIAAFLESNNG